MEGLYETEYDASTSLDHGYLSFAVHVGSAGAAKSVGCR
jgi:hypothetical protein